MSAFFTSRKRDSRTLRLSEATMKIAFVITILACALISSAQSYTPARTPDGQPDLQGMYTRNGIVGLEANAPDNPIDPGGNNPLSVSNRCDGLGPYPGNFGQAGT